MIFRSWPSIHLRVHRVVICTIITLIALLCIRCYLNRTDIIDRNIIAKTLNDDAGFVMPRCRSCAYIAGSGHMKDSNCGKEIDAHDCVFRPNDSPTTGYEADVGEKTTMRTVDLRSLTFIRKRLRSGKAFDISYKNMSFVIYGPTKQEREEILQVAYHLKNTYPGMKFNMMKPAVIKYIIDTFQREIDYIERNIWISNGFYTLLYMGDICSNITVYGMPYANYCKEQHTKNVQYHYYERSETECLTYNRHSKATRSTHRFLKEKRALDIRRGIWKNLTFRNPAWPDT